MIYICINCDATFNNTLESELHAFLARHVVLIDYEGYSRNLYLERNGTQVCMHEVPTIDNI
jgi:hypothetical protein